MRRLLFAVALVTVLPGFVFASPCVPDSLASYIGLGSTGCQIGTSTFFDFSSGPSFFGGVAINPSTISVIPVLTGLGFDFVLVPIAAGPGEVHGVAIGYSVSGFQFIQAQLSMTGSTATGDGVVTVIEDLCLEGTFVTNPGNCSNPPPVSLVIAQDSLGPTGPDVTLLPPGTSFFDVFTDITIDGGLIGTASVTTVRNQFAVPEPSTFLLLSSGLVTLSMARARMRANSTTLHRRCIERVESNS